MANNIKSKNIKFNIITLDDKLIIDYFDTHKDNFSKVTKSLLLDYVTNAKNKSSKSIIDVLEEHTKLLKEIVQGDRVLSSNNSEKANSSEESKSKKEESEDDFNMEFLNQIKK